MDKLYLSFLLLGLTALYCPEGEIVVRSKLDELGSRIESRKTLSGEEYTEFMRLSEQWLDSHEQQQRQAELAHKDEEIARLQVEKQQLAANLDEVIRSNQEGSEVYENALKLSNQLHVSTPSYPHDVPTVTEVDSYSDNSDLDNSDTDAQKYAEKVDRLLRRYDDIIKRIAAATQEDVVGRDRSFKAAQALADGLQQALGALDNYVNGADGETYQEMLNRVDNTFKQKADRVKAQINLTLDTLRAMAFDDVSKLFLTFDVGGRRDAMLVGDIQDFKNTIQIIFGLTDQGVIDTKINLGDTSSAQAFRQFGMELFRNAHNAQALEGVLGRWCTQIFTDLAISMKTLKDFSGTMPDIKVVSGVLKPMLESHIENIVKSIQTMAVSSDNQLALVQQTWQIHQQLDLLFYLHDMLFSGDFINDKIKEYKRGLASLWNDVKNVLDAYFFKRTSNGASSVVQAAFDDLTDLVHKASTLTMRDIKIQKDVLLKKYKINAEGLEQVLLMLKELCGHELSDTFDDMWSAGKDSFSSEQEQKDYFNRLLIGIGKLEDVVKLLQQVDASVMVHPEYVQVLKDEQGPLDLLLASKTYSEDGQLVVLSPEDQVKKLKENLEQWELYSKVYKSEVAKIPVDNLPDDLKDRMMQLKETISIFDKSLDQAKDVIEKGINEADDSALGVARRAINQIDIVLKGLPSLAGTDPVVQKIVKPFSDNLINIKEAMGKLVFDDLHNLLEQYNAASEGEDKQALLGRIKQIWEDQNSLYLQLYDLLAISGIKDELLVYKTSFLNMEFNPEDYPLLTVPVTDSKNPQFSRAALVKFGEEIMDYLSPAKLLLPENELALVELGKQLLFDGSWQKVGDNFALNSYDALVAQRNFDALGLHGAPIDWSNVSSKIFKEVALSWLEPIKDKDPKSLPLKQLQLICESFHSLYKSADGGSRTELMATYRNMSSKIVSSQRRLEQFLYDCKLGGKNNRGNPLDAQPASDTYDKSLESISPVVQKLRNITDDYTAWLDQKIGQDRARVEEILK